MGIERLKEFTLPYKAQSDSLNPKSGVEAKGRVYNAKEI